MPLGRIQTDSREELNIILFQTWVCGQRLYLLYRQPQCSVTKANGGQVRGFQSSLRSEWAETIMGRRKTTGRWGTHKSICNGHSSGSDKNRAAKWNALDWMNQAQTPKALSCAGHGDPWGFREEECHDYIFILEQPFWVNVKEGLGLANLGHQPLEFFILSRPIFTTNITLIPISPNLHCMWREDGISFQIL